MNNMRAGVVASVLALLVLPIASCGTEPEVKNTITVDQAEERVEHYIRQAVDVLPAQARPEPGLIHTTDCDDPTDNGPQGRKVASADYQIFDLSPAEYPKYVADLERWWRDNGFRILDDERPTYQSISVENNEDGFRIRVQDNDQGELYITASSPCVWPHGTPEPE